MVSVDEGVEMIDDSAKRDGWWAVVGGGETKEGFLCKG